MSEYNSDILNLGDIEKLSIPELIDMREIYKNELNKVLSLKNHIEFEEMNTSIFNSWKNDFKKTTANFEIKKINTIISYIEKVIYNKKVSADTDIIRGETSHHYYCNKANDSQKNRHYEFFNITDFLNVKQDLIDRGTIIFRYDIEKEIDAEPLNDDFIDENEMSEIEDLMPLDKSTFTFKLFCISQRNGIFMSLFIYGVNYSQFPIMDDFLKNEFVKMKNLWKEFFINENIK